ncbi:MAG TPA: CoA transferase, partial [Candidatus Binatia bacterium]|nr:CoA transferase [Candidatus Binatia bacterium]
MKPLAGLMVLDLTRFLAGPYCTLLLGGLGAEVIKVEQPDSAEVQRNRPPFGGPKGASLTKQTADDISMTHLHRSRNKKSITLNLRHPQGKELFLQLCAKADVVVENFAPGTLEGMGFGFPILQARNPRLILCSISGFGQRGPRREWRAYDPIIQAASGITSVTGYADRPPVRA